MRGREEAATGGHANRCRSSLLALLVFGCSPFSPRSLCVTWRLDRRGQCDRLASLAHLLARAPLALAAFECLPLSLRGELVLPFPSLLLSRPASNHAHTHRDERITYQIKLESQSGSHLNREVPQS
jgi:hypothetical protein